MNKDTPNRADLVFLQAALPDLRDYILSSELYWPLRPERGAAAGLRLPQLTIGNLLLSMARLKGESAVEFEQIQALRDEWLSNWRRKAAREFESRLNLWQRYLLELRESAGRQPASFASEVRNRVILQLLRSETGGELPPHVDEQLAGLDAILRGITRSGPFVWEPELQAAFPQQEFWFLYVTFPAVERG